MTKSERRQVAATLVEWAAWCEANPYFKWHEWPLCFGGPAWRAAYQWCHKPHVNGLLFDVSHRGPVAATGLLLAAAMVESGDSA